MGAKGNSGIPKDAIQNYIKNNRDLILTLSKTLDLTNDEMIKNTIKFHIGSKGIDKKALYIAVFNKNMNRAKEKKAIFNIN